MSSAIGTNNVVPYKGNLNDDGLFNLLEAVVIANAKDFVKGYGVLKKTFGVIPSENDFYKYLKSRKVYRDSEYTKMINYYQAVNWIKADPWGLVSEDPESVVARLKVLAEEFIKDKSILYMWDARDVIKDNQITL